MWTEQMKKDPGQAEWWPMNRSPGCWNSILQRRDTPILGVLSEAHGRRAQLNTSLRAVKDADPARLFAQDLLGG